MRRAILLIVTFTPRRFFLALREGFEPPTKCLTGTRSTAELSQNVSSSPYLPGHLLLAVRPYHRSKSGLILRAPTGSILVEMTGFEPATFCVQGRCSPKLSYIPDYRLYPHVPTPCVLP